MLAALSIRDIVLIDRLDLSFAGGLCVLTGETGAGKSILLDALGLALGARADAGLVRRDADRASVTASFDLPQDHPVFALLREQDLPCEGPVLRRVVTADGRSRAFVNDEPVSVGFLRQLGDVLVEVQGQFDQRGLMDPANHRAMLDSFGRLGSQVEAVAVAWRSWREALVGLQEMEAAVEQARRDEDFLRHAVAELDELAPQPGEEEHLAESRATLMNRERIAEALQAASTELGAGRGVDAALRGAQRALERVADRSGGLFDAALAALERAAIELAEALGELESAAARIETGGARLEEIEGRLFALRAAARKHGTNVESLPALAASLRERLAALDDQSDVLTRLARAEADARAAYMGAAAALSRARAAAAKALDAAVAAELPPLRLDKARFRTRLEPAPESAWGPAGVDRAAFEVSTNPGAPFGALARIASGGELSRFMLALKVVLAATGSARTLVFDEVDAGIGGAVAAAVGERLARLAESVQVLVVTHSPQVAARGGQHWHVVKRGDNRGVVVTRVEELSPSQRREEIARMISGARITDEARAAADSLMAQSGA